MLSGADEAFDSSSDSRFSSNDRYEWSYGGRSSSLYGSSVNSYRDTAVAAKSVASSNFQFRSADSFLKNLNNSSKGNNVDLSGYRAGVRVFHKKFGEGIINMVEAEGEDLKVDINFEKVGHKRLMAKFAGLEIIE